MSEQQREYTITTTAAGLDRPGKIECVGPERAAVICLPIYGPPADSGAPPFVAIVLYEEDWGRFVPIAFGAHVERKAWRAAEEWMLTGVRPDWMILAGVRVPR